MKLVKIRGHSWHVYIIIVHDKVKFRSFLCMVIVTQRKLDDDGGMAQCQGLGIVPRQQIKRNAMIFSLNIDTCTYKCTYYVYYCNIRPW